MSGVHRQCVQTRQNYWFSVFYRLILVLIQHMEYSHNYSVPAESPRTRTAELMHADLTSRGKPMKLHAL